MKLIHTTWRIHLLLLFCWTASLSGRAQTVNLATGNGGTINGAIFSWTAERPTGTGYIESFVRIQRKGTEQGYNTSGRPQPFDEKSALNFTHDLQLSQMATVLLNGTEYYQFLLDINEPGNEKAYLSLDELKVFTSAEGSQTTREISQLGVLRYDLDAGGDHWILLDASRNSGSGSGDMYFFLPKATLSGSKPTDFLYLYSKFGTSVESRSEDSEAGFEEWALVAGGAAFPCPSATAHGGTLTCEQTAVQLDVTTDTAGATFKWSGPNGFTSTAQRPSVTVAGTYTVTVTGPNGCSATDTALVTLSRNVPVITARGGTISCAERTTRLSASATGANVTFSWSGPGLVSGANTATPEVNAGGTYTVTATDALSGCSSSATVVVTESTEELRVTASGGELTCNRPNIQLGATVSGGGTVQFQWAGPGIISGGNSANPTVNIPGTYSVQAVDAKTGCAAESAAVVTENRGQLTVSVESSVLTGPTTQLNAITSSGPIKLDWSGPGIVSGQGTGSITVNQPGQYFLTVLDSVTGCTAIATAHVTLASRPVTVTAQGEAITCVSPTVRLEASASVSNVRFNWSGPGIVSGADTATPTVNVPGIYTVTVRDLSSGATVTAQAEVVDRTAQIILAVTGGTLSTAQPTIQLGVSASSAVTFRWSGPGIVAGGDTAQPTVNQPGTYAVTATDAATGCSASATVPVTMSSRPAGITVGTVGGLLDCIDTVTQIRVVTSAQSPKFSWSGPGIISGANSATPTVALPGTYTVVVRDGMTGASTQAVAIVTENKPPLKATATGGVLDCIDRVVTVRAFATSSNVSYRWTGPGILSGENTSGAQVDFPGVYTVTVTDLDTGCVTTASTVVRENRIPDFLPELPSTPIQFKVVQGTSSYLVTSLRIVHSPVVGGGRTSPTSVHPRGEHGFHALAAPRDSDQQPRPRDLQRERHGRGKESILSRKTGAVRT